MTIVYGNTIEPGGMKLDSDCFETECPECHSPKAIMRFWESCEGGSINQNRSLSCNHCFYTEGDGEDNHDDEYRGQSEFDIYSINEIFELAIESINLSIDHACSKAVHDIKHQSRLVVKNIHHIYA